MGVDGFGYTEYMLTVFFLKEFFFDSLGCCVLMIWGLENS